MNGRDLVARAEELKQQFAEAIDCAVRAAGMPHVAPDDVVTFILGSDGRLSIGFRTLPHALPPPLSPEAEEAVRCAEAGFTLDIDDSPNKGGLEGGAPEADADLAQEGERCERRIFEMLAARAERLLEAEKVNQ